MNYVVYLFTDDALRNDFTEIFCVKTISGHRLGLVYMPNGLLKINEGTYFYTRLISS